MSIIPQFPLIALISRRFSNYFSSNLFILSKTHTILRSSFRSYAQFGFFHKFLTVLHNISFNLANFSHLFHQCFSFFNDSLLLKAQCSFNGFLLLPPPTTFCRLAKKKSFRIEAVAALKLFYVFQLLRSCFLRLFLVSCTKLHVGLCSFMKFSFVDCWLIKALPIYFSAILPAV